MPELQAHTLLGRAAVLNLNCAGLITSVKCKQAVWSPVHTREQAAGKHLRVRAKCEQQVEEGAHAGRVVPYEGHHALRDTLPLQQLPLVRRLLVLRPARASCQDQAQSAFHIATARCVQLE